MFFFQLFGVYVYHTEFYQSKIGDGDDDEGDEGDKKEWQRPPRALRGTIGTFGVKKRRVKT